jgi:hypothetical protein
MANKTIINSAPPKPSKRIIGGSNQRSKARLNLQGSHGWSFNHAPTPLNQADNAIWWKERAPRYVAPLSSSGDVLYTRQSVKREVQRENDRRRIYNLNAEIDNPIRGGSNQPLNKKYHLGDKTFTAFDQEINIRNEIYPNTKKRVSFGVTIDGKTYNSEEVVPFSLFSSSVTDGYQATLAANGFGNVDFANLHDDKIQSYQGEVPLQGPFTERYVGGILSRHNAPLRTTERQESFNITLDPGLIAQTFINVDVGADPLADGFNGKVLTLTLGGVSFSATFSDAVDIADSTKTVMGIKDAIDSDGAADAISRSLTLAASADNLPITVVYNGVPGFNYVNVKGTFVGTRDNGTNFAGNAVAAGIVVPTPSFSGGRDIARTMNEPTVGNPQGKYLRGLGPKAPVNIGNIKTLFTSDSVRVVGNYIKNYEVVQTANRAATNMDLAFNTENYNYSAPSAFITTPARRTAGLVGSADYPAPRQIASRRTNDTIFVNRFSAPGGKQTSKQQFRDVASDQFSPNSALPFRNLAVRMPYLKKLGTHTLFGGFESGTSTTIAAVYKVQRNETQRIVSSNNTFVTGNLFDTYFFNRPIPAGDSTQWFFSLSGSNTNTYSNYVLSGSKYPEHIFLTKAALSTPFGRSAYTASDGLVHYVWTDYGTPYSAPWAQLGAQYKNAARNLRKTNTYDLLPQTIFSNDAVNNAASTNSKTTTDQAGNTITTFYSQQITEPPITSKYKPLTHQIETFIGSPSDTTENKITLGLEYSYGNSLMGFANRELNRQLKGDVKFAFNKIKRPYEVLREQKNSDTNASVNGINMIKMFAYNETIFPREINTYTSGSRARLAFQNSYWRNDAFIDTVTTFYNNFDVLFYLPSIEKRDNRQVPRLVAPFTTSQGYVVRRRDQLPYNPSNPATQQAAASVPGTASMWPMDSYLWSDLSHTYAGATFNTGTFSAPVILADQSTTACGELMMTNFGTVVDYMTDSNAVYNTSSLSSYTLSDIVSSQYVYSLAFVTGNLGSASKPNFGSASVEPRIPGGPFSRPPWTAGSERLYVDGESKGLLAPREYPFYNSYEDWAQELRLKAKAHTIVPEYRVSEHVSQFKTNRSVFTAISSSLEITGANTTNFDGTNTNFYTRYATSDNMEFLSDFMSYDKGDINFIFNNYPRHLEISSDAIIKLLPYNGFYPVNRTLEISTLFSQSYAPYSMFTGSQAGERSQWRALLRPYFAPGIMYNSIKSGIAVDYPIRRVNKNSGGFGIQYSYLADPQLPQYKIGHPLFGVLYGDITGGAASNGIIPGNSRRNRSNFDWSDPNVNALYWADRLPFESILSPEDYLSADLETLTGSQATVMSDISPFLHLKVTASFSEGAIDSNNLYKKAVSNFIANVPEFFLKTKNNKFGSPGKLTKFVSQFGNPSKGSQEVTTAARTVAVDPKKAYMMEIGLMKTDQFNMYSNPAAFGPSTNTSYIYKPWEVASASGSWIPSGSSWPKHRGEYAPFAPPYYYGPSLARITFMPTGDKKEYTLNEILDNDRGEVFIDFLNESGSYYDATSGSFVDSYGNTLTTTTTPAYLWNRAWLNRMDIDASINIGNEFATSAGSSYRSSDPNKWTIMPKWESPILDFPNIIRTPEIPATSGTAATASISIVDYDSLLTAADAMESFVITGSSGTVVEFILGGAEVSHSRVDATTYLIAFSSSLVADDGNAATQIAGAIDLSLSNGDLDVDATSFKSATPARLDLTCSVIGTAINGNLIQNKVGTPISPSTMTVGGPFAGGTAATSVIPASTTVGYNFSSSVNASEFTSSTQGMWHQYGSSPNEGEGVYMYIKDIPTGNDEEYDLVANVTATNTGRYNYVKKIPKFVIDSNRSVDSLADLCGFDSEEIIRKGFDPTKAKRLGELAEDGENSISEGVVALPFYLDENGEPKLITLQCNPSELGPKIKEFRKNFTKYSFPPALAQKLIGLVPKGYPSIPRTINPFGGDEYDEIMAGEDITQIPVIYLMEHRATLTKQDLADIWQGIMPDLSRKMNFSFSAIDHYMPGTNVEETPQQFPEVLKEQINVGAVRDGIPRYDLLDIAEKACKQGFFPEIKWLVFKVKQKGISTYGEMIIQEVDGPNALGYDNSKEFLTLQGLPSDQVERILGDRDDFAKNAYISKHSLDNPTFNWPYDYCSLVEAIKIDSKVGFRPDLDKEYEEVEAKLTQAVIDEKAGNK